uniref:kinesin-like protein KIF18A n=1 Tax=Myxine glutinosa TaxID=7769 RepID=UPI00358E3173
MLHQRDMEDKLCRMRVVVRVRPENKRECAASFSSVVQVLDDQMLIFDPKEEDDFPFFNGPRLRAPIARRRKDLRFVFDTVFDATASQADVYKGSTQKLLQHLLQGINCTVFAYGATGAGKTHTMMGTKNEPGLMCRTLEEMFECVEQRQSDKSCTIAMSYLEVYNEQISDLLMSNGPLSVYEDPQKGVCVKNLSIHKPKSVEELLRMLEKGNQNRTQHPTDANALSSRSHALLQIYLKQEERDPSLSHNALISKLSLIDLAGSERAFETNNSGQRMREGSTINCSLLALGSCINALADPKTKKQHIPYRNSKLTRLLKDTLGGNCQTIMVAAISPSSASYEDTYNTLNYASRAKDIKYMLKSNVLSSEKHISRYFKACKDLKEEVAALKAKLAWYEAGREIKPILPSVTNEPCNAQTLRLQTTMQNLFKERCSLHGDSLHAQAQLKEMELRAYLRERDQERIRIFCSEESLDKATGKLERCIAANRTRCDHLEKRRRRADDRLKKEDGKLQHLQADIATSDVLRSSLTRGLVEEENVLLKGHLRHLMQLAASLEQDKEHTERLMHSLLHMARSQFNTLRSTGLAGSEEFDAMTAAESLVKRLHGVAWADQDTLSPHPTSSESHLPRFSLVQFLTFPRSKLMHHQVLLWNGLENVIDHLWKFSDARRISMLSSAEKGLCTMEDTQTATAFGGQIGIVVFPEKIVADNFFERIVEKVDGRVFRTVFLGDTERNLKTLYNPEYH